MSLVQKFEARQLFLSGEISVRQLLSYGKVQKCLHRVKGYVASPSKIQLSTVLYRVGQNNLRKL